MTRTEAYMTLNAVRDVGSVRAKRLIGAFQTPQNVLGQSASSLSQVEGIGPKVADSILRHAEKWNVEKEKEKLSQINATVLDWDDEAYPPKLKEIYDPPMVLYIKGSAAILNRRCLAIVGSRNTSSYGYETARKLGYQCAYAGLTVVSGLARGIDTAAHQGACAAGGITAAIFGTALDTIFPAENVPLADKILETGGAWVSELPLGTRAEKFTFPMRNRIISGLSEGTLLVEAGRKSGALITAKLALEHGRTVFAVPGRIDNPHSQGCHQLIKEGARLVEDVQDVLGEFEFLFPRKELETGAKMPTDLSEEEVNVLKQLELDELHIDVIIQKSGLPSSVVSTSLLRLELKRLVRQLPGKFYIRTN